MERFAMVERLLAAPERIAKAEQRMLDALDEVEQARRQLVEREDALTLEGAIDGKNAETRGAQLREQTRAERFGVDAREKEMRRVKADYYLEINTFAALRAASRTLTNVE